MPLGGYRDAGSYRVVPVSSVNSSKGVYTLLTRQNLLIFHCLWAVGTY